MPLYSIKLPARMKKGIAIRGKEFKLANILCIATSKEISLYINASMEDNPIEKATGTPKNKKKNKLMKSRAATFLPPFLSEN